MTKNLDSLTKEELGRLFPVIISEFNDEWKTLFHEEKRRIVDLLGKERVIRVEHIGSTAVPGLLAKPTIDILVEIPIGKILHNEINEIMTSSGYIHMKEQTDHLMFVKGYTPEGFKGQCYHIHMGPKEQESLWERLYFKDYLILNPTVAAEYAALKKGLSKKFKYDRDAYTEAKTEFIKKITCTAKAAFMNRPTNQ